MRHILFLLLLFFCHQILAQNDPLTAPSLLYKSQRMYGGNLHTKGWGLNYKHGIYRNAKNITLFDVEFLKMRHPKEVRILNSAFENPKPYVFGKLNSAFFLRTGIGNKRMIAEKFYKTGIAVHISYSAGLTTCLLKPVYLDIYKKGPNDDVAYVIAEKYDPEVHVDQGVIYGFSKFGEGLDEIEFMAGAHGKAALNFEWGEYSDEMKNLEVGMAADAFPSELPLMAFTKNKNIFTTFYICFSFGNKR